MQQGHGDVRVQQHAIMARSDHNGTYSPADPPTAVLYRRALDLLIKHRPSRELFPIVVSQVPCATSCSEAIVFFGQVVCF